MIITDLILEYKLKYTNSYHEYYLSAEFQTKISKILKISNYIQTNNLHFGEEDCYSESDYFEALLYEIYRINGYKATKEFLEKILMKFEDIITNEEIIEDSINEYQWTNNLSPSLNFKLHKLSIYFDGLDEKHTVQKLINSFICDYFKLITNDNNFYNLDYLSPSTEINNMLMCDLYNIFHTNFDEFEKSINVIKNKIKH
ncbi:MAG: hypothetical protein K2K73_02535 [Ureaplasma sp.]|nr:hypothetical protein [Ureaplasma sp.]